MFRATKILGYIRAMDIRAISAAQLLDGTDIDYDLVVNASYVISLKQYQTVIRNMITLTNDPGIAFSLGSLGNLQDFGIYGYAMISSASVRRALGVMSRYANSLMGTQIQAEEIREISEGYEVTFSSNAADDDVIQRFETEETLVMGVKMMRDLTGVNPVYGKISFAYPEPAHRILYENLLQSPLEFDAPRTVIRIVKPTLDTPIQTMNQELFDLCAERCHQVMRSLSGDHMLVNDLRDLFLKTPGNLPGIDDAAAALGLSTRTFCRQLSNLGKTYQVIKDEFRFSLACEYLQSGTMLPKQIAYLLGFKSQSNFARAFKSWTGQTIGQFLKAGGALTSSSNPRSPVASLSDLDGML